MQFQIRLFKLVFFKLQNLSFKLKPDTEIWYVKEIKMELLWLSGVLGPGDLPT